MMDLRPIRYFIEVAEHLNFTEAAKRLYVAQPAVSQQIAYLERKLGVKLLYRNKHSVRLTNAGAIFYRDAVELLHKLDEAIENARQAEAGLIGNLSIGLLSVPVRNFLPVLVRRFRQAYPQVNIRFHHYQLGQILEKLKSDEIDIAFTLSVGLQSVGGLAHKTLFTQPHCAIVHRDHPLAVREKISLAELADEPFVMLERQEHPPGYDLLLAACAKHGFSPRLVNQASRIDAVLMMVDAGFGITVLPRYHRMLASPSLRFVEIEDEDLHVDILVCWKTANPNPTIPLFLQEMDRLLAERNADFFGAGEK